MIGRSTALNLLHQVKDYLKDRADYAEGEDDHVTASKAICRLSELEKLILNLPITQDTPAEDEEEDEGHAEEANAERQSYSIHGDSDQS